MKASFWICFEGTLDQGATKVTSVRAAGLTQSYPKVLKGIPIQFEVDVPDEFFLERRVKISASIDPPGSSAAPPTVAIRTKWDDIKDKHGA